MRSSPPRKTRSWRNSLAAAALLLLSAEARADALDRLVLAYPETLAARDGNAVVLRDGTRIDAGPRHALADFDALLTRASLQDQLALAYPSGPLGGPPQSDPGRLRNKAFFDALYGDCRKDEVAPHLVSIVWLPRSWGHRIEATAVNGVAERLKAVSAEIDALPEAVRRAAFPIAGTYACRAVADQGQPSLHAYGAAIDLNLAFSNYWLWQTQGAARYRNRMPDAIVAAFERHGFVWGGKWLHFDTMHFEYRPELLALPPAAALR